MLEILVRAALLMLSFFGLCCVVRETLRLNRFIAPYVTVSGIILVLMAAGMLHVLKYGAWLLYIAGWASWIYILIRRYKPDLALMLLCAAFVVWLGWQLGECKSWHTDDFSHWTLAVDSLLRRDAFPDASETLITFQSYPMGATVFIYYAARFLGDGEGLRFVAQNFLCGALLMTLFAHVNGRRRVMVPLTAAAVVFLYKFNRNFQELQVDWLLSYFGIGIASAVIYYRNDLRKMLIAALPGMAAVTFVKHSGIFFALVCAALMVVMVKRLGCPRRMLVRTAVIAVAVPVIAFALWTIHAKLSYPAALDSKHAVSAVAYVQTASAKTLRMILGTAVRMVLKWFRISYAEIFAIMFALACFAVTHMLKRSQPEASAALGRYLLGCLGVFVLWLVMLYAMYIFSMPAAETHKLASYERYMSSGLLFPVGLAMIGLLECFSREDMEIEGSLKRFGAAAVALCIVTAPMANGYAEYFSFFGRWRMGYPEGRGKAIAARDACGLQPDGSYIAFTEEGVTARSVCFILRRDLDSEDVAVVTRDEETGEYLCTRLSGKEQIEDISAWLADRAGETDALLILSESDEFEAAVGQTGAEDGWAIAAY